MSRVNFNIMKNYKSPVPKGDYVQLLEQRCMYLEPMHNDEYCAVAHRLLSERLVEMRNVRADKKLKAGEPVPEVVAGERNALHQLYDMYAHFLVYMFPRHSSIGDVGDIMGISTSLLVWDCMMFALACYTELVGGLARATRDSTDSSDEDTVVAQMALWGPDVHIAQYTQMQLLNTWECVAKRTRDTWPTAGIGKFRWCLMLRTADLCVHAEPLGAPDSLFDYDQAYVQTEGEWRMASARFLEETMFYFVQTEQLYMVLLEEVIPREHRAPAKPKPAASAAAKKAYREKRDGPPPPRPPLESTNLLGDESCRRIFGPECTFGLLCRAFADHFRKTCETTSNDTFIKAITRRWCDCLIHPGAKCYAFFENKYSATPDTSEILRIIFSVSLRTWLQNLLPRQPVTTFVEPGAVGIPLLEDAARAMVLQQMVGLHSSEIVWDEECYIDDTTAPRYLLPAYSTKPNERGYQINNTMGSKFELDQTEIFKVARAQRTWPVPVRDRDSRQIPTVIRLCGGHWVRCAGKYYRVRTLCDAFVLWVLLIVDRCQGMYIRPNGHKFDVGFLLSMVTELWELSCTSSVPNRAREWVAPGGGRAEEGRGLLVIKKRTDVK